MKVNKLARREAKSLFRTCFIGGIPDEQRVRKAVKSLIDQKPRGYMAILAHFQKLLKLDIQSRTARVEGAVPLDEAAKSKIQHQLGRIYNEGLNVTFHVNPSLIGGLKLQVGSDVYNNSVRAKLEQLKDNF